MKTVKVFDPKFHELLNNSISSVLIEDNNEQTGLPNENQRTVNDSNSLTCSYCMANFKNAEDQREHYKLDWHRYNLRLSLMNRSPLTEDNFNKITNEDELSSISGSDSEKETTNDLFTTAQGKIYLQTSDMKVFSIYTCLVLDRKEETTDSVLFQRLLNSCKTNQQWTILMLGGGHFAGAVFSKETPILHKTFHCYTVRAKQGGSQSARDNKTGGTHPKSAGAALRRNNEQALAQRVRDIIESWKEEIGKSSLIFYRAAGPYNRLVLFGESSMLNRDDPRLRTIPFSTRRATFNEIKRVHAQLIAAQIYESLENATEYLSKQKSESKRSKPQINRSKSREEIQRPLPGDDVLNGSSSSSESEEVGFETKMEELEINCNDSLLEFDDSLTPEQRQHIQQKRKKKKKPQKSKTKKLKEKEEARRKEIMNVLIRGDIESLKSLKDNEEFYNEILDENMNSLLHIAALNEHEDLLKFLLENNANPTVKNKLQQTAYTCTQSKAIRIVLKEFARENPEKYNYNKAHIPVNTLTDEEQAEKRRQQRKLKQEKMKVKRKENDILKKEQLEKDQFLKLSDREKRALAAERRMLESGIPVKTLRCFTCASDMTGKVPFEYLGNRFCTIECLKAHRLSKPLVLS